MPKQLAIWNPSEKFSNAFPTYLVSIMMNVDDLFDDDVVFDWVNEFESNRGSEVILDALTLSDDEPGIDESRTCIAAVTLLAFPGEAVNLGLISVETRDWIVNARSNEAKLVKLAKESLSIIMATSELSSEMETSSKFEPWIHTIKTLSNELNKFSGAT